MQGVPGDCRRLAPTKTFLLSCEIDLGRQVDVPAVCGTFNRASCVLLLYVYIDSIAVYGTSECEFECKIGLRFKVMLGLLAYFTIKGQQGNPDPFKASLQHVVLMSQLSSELTAELKSLMRTAYQECLGVRV